MKLSHQVLAAVAAALTAGSHAALAQGGQSTGQYGYYGPHMMWWDGGWSMFFFGPLFMILTLVVIVGAAVYAARWFGGNMAPGSALPSPQNRALDILKERYARGEIDKAEYDERRRTLSE